VGAPLAGQGFRSHSARVVTSVCHEVSTKHLHQYPDEYAFRYNKTGEWKQAT
jgi:hypothetical protein